MDLLQDIINAKNNEIQQKRKLLEEKNLSGPQRKYFKISELQNTSEIEKQADPVVEESNRSNEKLVEEDQHFAQALSRKEVIRRLRERGDPILLFNETELQSFERLRRCEILEPEANKVISLKEDNDLF